MTYCGNPSKGEENTQPLNTLSWVKCTIIRIKLAAWSNERYSFSSAANQQLSIPCEDEGDKNCKLCLVFIFFAGIRPENRFCSFCYVWDFFSSNSSSARWWSLGHDSLAFGTHQQRVLTVGEERGTWSRFLNILEPVTTSSLRCWFTRNLGIWLSELCAYSIIMGPAFGILDCPSRGRFD